MKISFITSYLPSLSSGSAVRTYNLLKYLAKGNDVLLFSAVSKENRIVFSDFLKNVHEKTYTFKLPKFELNKRIVYYLQQKIPYIEVLKQSNFYEVLKYIPEDTDIIHIAEFQAYSIIEPYLNKLPGIKVLDAHNVDYLRLKSEFDSSPIYRKVAGYPLIKKLKDYETDAVKKIDFVLTCSKHDSDIYSQYIKEEKITVIPNGVDLKMFVNKGRKEEKHTVLFIGNLSYSPNEFGIKWYLEHVHPLIKRKVSDYKIIITGISTPQWLKNKALYDHTIQLKGFVEDITSEIAGAQVCICPILSGSGTRLKLLEYMAMKKAIVSTTAGAEGIEVRNNKHIMLANSPMRFSEAVQKLFDNVSLRSALGNDAYLLSKQKYDWDNIGSSLEKFYKSL